MSRHLFGGSCNLRGKEHKHHGEAWGANALMPLSYSRDNITALHSRVFRMLTAIRNFEFYPDDSNAARIFQENKDLLPEQPEIHHQPGEWAASESDVSGDDESMPADSVTGQICCTKFLWWSMLRGTVKPCGVAVRCRKTTGSGKREIQIFLSCWQQCGNAQP